MNKLQTLFLSALLCTGNVCGQIEQDVDSILKTKDFAAFKAFSDSLTNPDKGISGHWEILRDLAGDFREGVFLFEKLVPEKDYEEVSSCYWFRVNVLVTGSDIVYYELAEIKSKKSRNGWAPYLDSMDSFRDDQAMEELNAVFKTIFLTDLDEQELFTTSLVYGEQCGFKGGRPDGRDELEVLMTNWNKPELVKWLQSGNAEKQVYAIEGLYRLTQLGVKLTAEELRMIHYVSNKKGTVHTCHSILRDYQEIFSVTYKFGF